MALAEAIDAECASRRCIFQLTVTDESRWLRSVTKGPLKELESPSPDDEEALSRANYFVFMMGPKRPIPWNRIPKNRRDLVSVWLDTRYDRSAYARKWAKIAAKHKVKMLAVEATLVTPERAATLGLNPEEWRSVMLHGCFADHRTIAGRAKRLAKVMSGRGEVMVSTAAGTHLTFELDRRRVGVSDGISSDGMAEEARIVFLPAGAIEVSINETSAVGRIVFDTPVRLVNETIENLVIELKDGLIRKYSTTRGSELFTRYLEGGKDAGRLSYFGFGLNPNLRYGFTQDDKILGGLTLGFGDNVSIGGKNSSGGQWWASLTGPTAKINGRTLLEAGSLLD
jgi:leucyl aminopeptidase (aminopeptidase T)